MVCLEYDITSHIIFCVFFVFLMLHYITETCPQTTGLNPTDLNSSSWQVRLSNITTRQTSKARSLCYKLPDSAPLGLAMCCRLVGNTQTLNPLGRQLAQTKRCFPPWQNTHMHTREKKPEKGKTHLSELKLGEIIAAVGKKWFVFRQTCFSQILLYKKKVPCMMLELTGLILAEYTIVIQYVF